MTAQLVDRELDGACGRAMGHEIDLYDQWDHTLKCTLPAYHASVDACLHDLVPECQRRAWEFQLTMLPNGLIPEITARACLAALQEVRE